MAGYRYEGHCGGLKQPAAAGFVPVAEGFSPAVLAAFERATGALAEAGARLIVSHAPSQEEFDLAVALGLIISRCEAAAYHRAFGDIHTNADRYTRPVYEQLDEAAQVSAVDYLQAQRMRAIVRERVLAQLNQFDALLMPTCLVTAPKSEAVEQYFMVLSQNCILWSFIGVPAISLPCGRSPDGLPIGAQLVAGPFEDRRLLAIASALESALAGVDVYYSGPTRTENPERLGTAGHLNSTKDTPTR